MAAICDGKCACHEMSRNSITIKNFTCTIAVSRLGMAHYNIVTEIQELYI